MSLAIYPIIENCEDSWITEFDGKILSSRLDDLSNKTLKFDCKQLMDFLTVDAEDLEEFGIDIDDSPEWFSPTDGMKTLDLYVQLIAEDINEDLLRQELQQLRAILQRASNEGRRWKLAVDF